MLHKYICLWHWQQKPRGRTEWLHLQLSDRFLPEIKKNERRFNQFKFRAVIHTVYHIKSSWKIIDGIKLKWCVCFCSPEREMIVCTKNTEVWIKLSKPLQADIYIQTSRYPLHSMEDHITPLWNWWSTWEGCNSVKTGHMLCLQKASNSISSLQLISGGRAGRVLCPGEPQYYNRQYWTRRISDSLVGSYVHNLKGMFFLAFHNIGWSWALLVAV